MSSVRRALTALRAVASDPVERRAYASRLKWLLSGTEGVQAWSLEYRSGLTGRFAPAVTRLAPDAEITIRCPESCAAASPLAHLYEQRFVYLLPDTIASTATGATLACGTPEPAFFVREGISWPFESVLAHGLEIPEVRQVQRVQSEPSIVFPTTTNYYHWLVEDLPLALRGHRVQPDAPLLAYEPGITDRHRLVAEHLGVPLLPSPLVIRLDHQVLPGRSSDSFFVHPHDLMLLRSFAESLTASSSLPAADSSELIYVSRRNSRRPLAGEAQLEGLLTQAGFAVVFLEDLPWIEQIRCFQNARLIVGPHGAGLANAVFSKPGATVVELTNGYMFNRCFEWICHVGDLHYLPIEADSGPQPMEPADILKRLSPALDRLR